jgi:hypothetical protein
MVLNLESEIEILLFDQNKIVTYKLLNNMFDLTPFQAKKELNKFIDKKKESTTFHSTYLIIGENKQSKNKNVFLSNEKDLNKVKEQYNILSKQIYSIHTNEIEDFDLIHGSDLDSSNNINRKCNLKVTSNLSLSQMELGQSDDDIMMKMDTETKDNKISKSKSEDQENKPVVKVEKTVFKIKEEKTDTKNSKVLKDMDQILPENDTKKQKISETYEINKPGEIPKSVRSADAANASAALPKSAANKAFAAAAKGKKTVPGPAKNQPSMMAFFKKK